MLCTHIYTLHYYTYIKCWTTLQTMQCNVQNMNYFIMLYVHSLKNLNLSPSKIELSFPVFFLKKNSCFNWNITQYIRQQNNEYDDSYLLIRIWQLCEWQSWKYKLQYI